MSSPDGKTIFWRMKTLKQMLEQVLQLSNYAETLIITNGTESLNFSIAVTNM
jgi:hypothetical protein